jgi:hypothetical protein
MIRDARRALAASGLSRSIARLALSLVMTLAAVERTQAQVVRITGSTAIRYLELRPLVRDSVAAVDVAGSGLLRQLTDGRIVRCIPEDPYCRDTHPGSRQATVPIIHDVTASVWGLGEGVRLFMQLRGRTTWGSGSELWPRAEDPVDVLAAYAEMERERLRVRAGRQWKVSGLGFYNFDGVTMAFRPVTSAWLEVYAGRSLLRGLNEPRTGGALESIEALAPPAAGLLLGVQARYRSASRLAASVVYQVDFRNDGGGRYSELAAADAVLALGSGSVEGSIELDVARVALNEARLRASAPPLGPVVLHAEVRRYRPYFELWTIWGAFSPVGFDEARAGATWAVLPSGRLLLRGDASWRGYDDPDDGISHHRSDGWGLGAYATWSPSAPWRLDAAYRVESGFGASRRDGHAGVARQLGDFGSIAVQALAFQRLFEFRLEEGTVLGIAAEANLRVSDRVRLFTGAAAYRHAGPRASAAPDWTQRRGSIRLQWTVGPEPGAGTRAAGPP